MPHRKPLLELQGPGKEPRKRPEGHAAGSGTPLAPAAVRDAYRFPLPPPKGSILGPQPTRLRAR